MSSYHELAPNRSGKDTRKALAAITYAALAALSIIAVIVAVVWPFPLQEQYRSAQLIAAKARMTGCEAFLADFEDGKEPDGCCIVASRDNDQMRVSITPEGDIAKVTYIIRLDGDSSTSGDDVNRRLTVLQELLANATDEIWTAVTRVEIPDDDLSKVMFEGNPTGQWVQNGQGSIHVACSFEPYRTFSLVRVAVDAPIDTIGI